MKIEFEVEPIKSGDEVVGCKIFLKDSDSSDLHRFVAERIAAAGKVFSHQAAALRFAHRVLKSARKAFGL